MIRWLWNKMMKWGWDFNHGRGEVISLGMGRNRGPLECNFNDVDEFRMSMAKAQNGKIVQITKPVLDKYGNPSDQREGEFYVVAEGQSLSEIVNTILNLEDMK